MKKILSKKILLGLAGALVVGFAGTVLVLSQTANQKKQETSTTTKNASSVSEKGDLPPSSTTTTKGAVKQAAPTNNATSLAALTTSVTAQISPTDDTVSITFYPEGGGGYTIEQQSGGSWKVVSENASYKGIGGLSGVSLAAGESSKTLRILKIQNGAYVAVSKTFTISRAEVSASGGIKTYN